MLKEITLAGGCFWGVQAFFAQLPGVKKTTAGYANGNLKTVTYDQVSHGDTGFSEAVKIIYDDRFVSLEYLLKKYFQVIDPVSENRQGNDFGTQYRTGIYYPASSAAVVVPIINRIMTTVQKKYSQPLKVEVTPLRRFVVADAFHQDYLKKHPQGYCHIDLSKIDDD